MLFRVDTITWVSETEVKVFGGYDEGYLSSSGNTYTVKKENGKWIVRTDQLEVISTNVGCFANPERAMKSDETSPLHSKWEAPGS